MIAADEITIPGCGCYDGPWSPEDDTDVSVRCPDHEQDPGFREGAMKMTKHEAQITASVHIPRALSRGKLRPKVQTRG